MSVEIVKAQAKHIRPMARRIRSAHAMTLQAYGFEPRKALHDAYMQSHYARTALIEGKPVAMWGLTGPLIGDIANVWLVTAEEVNRLPVTAVRRARRELAEIMWGYREIGTTVLPDDEAAVRFALYLGFHDGHGKDDPVGHKDRVRQVLRNPRHRIPVGDTYVIGLGYHQEAR